MSNTIKISGAIIGDNVLVAGNPSTPTIEIVELVLQCGAATTLIIRSGSNDLTGSMTFATGGGLNLPNSGQGPHLLASDGDSLIIRIASLVGSFGGYLVYNQY